MRICIVHNEYGRLSGEEVVVREQARLLREHGHEVHLFTRSSAEIMGSWTGHVQAFASGIHSPASRREMRRILKEWQPDLVHVHNLFPLISPAVLPVCAELNTPVVMTVHNYRLVCPNGLFMTKGEVCQRCAGGREWWCAVRNCESSRAKSIGYALRNYVARKRRHYLDHVSRYMVLTEFQRRVLIENGFAEERISVVPNMLSDAGIAPAPTAGDYVGFVGRVSPEKGIDTLLEAARLCPDIPFRIAGSYERMPDVAERLPGNVQLCGQLGGDQLRKHFQDSRFLVFPSIWFEGFPMTILEAYLYGRPVVCSRIGGLSEVVQENVDGLLFRPGDAAELAESIRRLWKTPDRCQEMGRAGRTRVMRQYGRERHYQRLTDVYAEVVPTSSWQASPGIAAVEVSHEL